MGHLSKMAAPLDGKHMPCELRKDPAKTTPRSSKELLPIENQDASLLLSKKWQLKPSAGKPNICRLPESSVLRQVRSFLPKLAAAELDLQAASPGSLDIEAVDDSEGPVIEMNLALVEDDSDESDSDCSDDSEQGQSDQSYHGNHANDGDSPVEEELLCTEITEENLKLRKSRTKCKPLIQVLSGDICQSEKTTPEWSCGTEATVHEGSSMESVTDRNTQDLNRTENQGSASNR